MNATSTYQVEVALPSRAELGEGPIWDERTQSLLWVDIIAGRVHRFRPDLGTDAAAEAGTTVGAVGLRADGGLVLALADGLALVDADQVRSALPEDARPPTPGGRHAGTDLNYTRLAGPAIATDGVRFNEAKADPEGRYLAGTMDSREREPLGALYQFEPDGRASVLVEHVTISNGLDFSDDRRTLYYIDTPAGGVDAFDRDPETGRLSNRRRAAEVPGSAGGPDGMTLDSEGCLWVAVWGAGEVRRFSPDGTLIGVVHVPARQVSSVVFGGVHLDELFITTARVGQSQVDLAAQPRAGDLFWLQPGVSGRPSFRFAG